MKGFGGSCAIGATSDATAALWPRGAGRGPEAAPEVLSPSPPQTQLGTPNPFIGPQNTAPQFRPFSAPKYEASPMPQMPFFLPPNPIMLPPEVPLQLCAPPHRDLKPSRPDFPLSPPKILHSFPRWAPQNSNTPFSHAAKRRFLPQIAPWGCLMALGKGGEGRGGGRSWGLRPVFWGFSTFRSSRILRPHFPHRSHSETASIRAPRRPFHVLCYHLVAKVRNCTPGERYKPLQRAAPPGDAKRPTDTPQRPR